MDITIHMPDITRLAEALLEVARAKPASAPPAPVTASQPITQATTPANEAAPTTPPQPVPTTTAPPITIDAVQRAAIQLSDQGKRADVLALFPEYGIRKISDLQGAEQLLSFASRLKSLGARIA